MSRCRLSSLWIAVLACSLLVDPVSAASPDTDNDCTAPDYTALLSIKPTGTLSIKSAVTLDEKTTIPGIVFIKMIKVAGELFSSTLSQYAVKRQWHTLQHKDCTEAVNPSGHATCACEQHYIGPDDTPPQPNDEHRYTALYTHMHYNPTLLQNYMVPGAVKLVLLRHPLSVLRSTHAMAAFQHIHQPEIHDDFCQDMAADGDTWRANCARMHNGLDSLLDYLDHDANDRLQQLFAEQPTDLHEQAEALINKAALLLEDFVVGIQEEFDASMLLFERALKWSRDDSLYVDHDINAHQFHGSEKVAALASWGENTPKGDEIVNKLRAGPYFYHELLYKKGVALYAKQMQATIGSKEHVASAVRTYRAQLVTFTDCMHETTLTKDEKGNNFQPNVCTIFGLNKYVAARPQCAKTAIDAELLHREVQNAGDSGAKVTDTY